MLTKLSGLAMARLELSQGRSLSLLSTTTTTHQGNLLGTYRQDAGPNFGMQPKLGLAEWNVGRNYHPKTGLTET